MLPLQNIVFTDAHQKWREIAREIAIKHLLPGAAKHDQESRFNEDAFSAAAEAGMLGIWIPKEYGGSEDGVIGLCLVIEEFSKADPAFGVGFAVVAFGLAVPLARRLGREPGAST